MVPAGKPTEDTVESLAKHLESGDIIIDGGNSTGKTTSGAPKTLKEKGIHYVDAGTSGGVWGLERGYCLMVGASDEAFHHIEPVIKTLAPGRATSPAHPAAKRPAEPLKKAICTAALPGPATS